MIEEAYSAPVHKWTATMRSSDGGKRERVVIGGLDVGNQMATVQTTHRMSEKVDAFASSPEFELFIERKCTFFYRSGSISDRINRRRSLCGRRVLPRDGSDNNLGIEFASEDAENVGPVVHTHAGERGWATDVEAIET
jgi:hypothetical protein